MYKIVMISQGGIRRDMFTDLTYQTALELCEIYDWIVRLDGGSEWELEIEEM